MQVLLLSLANGEGNQRQEESGFGVFIFLITFSLEAVDLLCLSTKGHSPVWAALSLPLLSIDSFFFKIRLFWLCRDLVAVLSLQ